MIQHQGVKLMAMEGNQDSVNEKLSHLPSGLAKGIYFLKITEGKFISTQKIIKL